MKGSNLREVDLQFGHTSVDLRRPCRRDARSGSVALSVHSLLSKSLYENLGPPRAEMVGGGGGGGGGGGATHMCVWGACAAGKCNRGHRDLLSSLLTSLTRPPAIHCPFGHQPLVIGGGGGGGGCLCGGVCVAGRCNRGDMDLLSSLSASLIRPPAMY